MSVPTPSGGGTDEFELVIAGAGGFGRTVLQFALDASVSVVGFTDDRPDVVFGRKGQYRVIGPATALVGRASWRLIVAVGDPESRKALVQRLSHLSLPWFTLVHPLAYVAPTARIGDGCIVGPFAFIGPDAILGDHVAVNAHGYVDHDVCVGAYGYVGPRGTISGSAQLGECVAVGAGATIGYGAVVAPYSRVRPGVVIES